VYSKHHNLCLHILKSCYIITISGVITLHTVSQFTAFRVLVAAYWWWLSAAETCSSGSMSCICFGMCKLFVL